MGKYSAALHREVIRADQQISADFDTLVCWGPDCLLISITPELVLYDGQIIVKVKFKDEAEIWRLKVRRGVWTGKRVFLD